jgi:hypothetical protein
VANKIPDSRKKNTNELKATIAPILKSQPIHPMASPTQGRRTADIRNNMGLAKMTWKTGS